MRINNNMMAMNTHRQLGAANAGGAKSMEKLSSGMRINRAGDDAAGLSISEKMRGQIRGLNQASANSQDGISMIQTAEGALNETHAILQRMRELAVQSATDTNTNDDRAKIQGEVDQLAKEITRISNTTEFNTQNLMAGGMSSKFHIGANEGQDVNLSINAMDASSLKIADDTKNTQAFLPGATGIGSINNASRGLEAGTDYKITTTRTGATASPTVSADIKQTAVGATTTNRTLAVTDGAKFTGTKDTNYIVKVDSVATGPLANKAESIKYSTDDGSNWKTLSLDTDGKATIDGMVFELAVAAATEGHVVGDQYSFTQKAAKVEIQLAKGSDNIGEARTVNAGNTSVTIGSGSDGKTIDLEFDFTKLATDTDSTFAIGSTKSNGAKVVDGKITQEASAAAGINVSSQGAASKAITTINDALETVSAERSKLGAMQNRLEHTIKNLDTSAENLQASEARIRDVDMAKEMMEQTKQNILAQASTAMLAQANASPEAVLQLLR